jgi:hypothetical protein
VARTTPAWGLQCHDPRVRGRTSIATGPTTPAWGLQCHDLTSRRSPASRAPLSTAAQGSQCCDRAITSCVELPIPRPVDAVGRAFCQQPRGASNAATAWESEQIGQSTAAWSFQCHDVPGRCVSRQQVQLPTAARGFKYRDDSGRGRGGHSINQQPRRASNAATLPRSTRSHARSAVTSRAGLPMPRRGTHERAAEPTPGLGHQPRGASNAATPKQQLSTDDVNARVGAPNATTGAAATWATPTTNARVGAPMPRRCGPRRRPRSTAAQGFQCCDRVLAITQPAARGFQFCDTSARGHPRPAPCPNTSRAGLPMLRPKAGNDHPPRPPAARGFEYRDRYLGSRITSRAGLLMPRPPDRPRRRSAPVANNSRVGLQVPRQQARAAFTNRCPASPCCRAPWPYERSAWL